MPVKKFRSVEDMETEIWRSPGDPSLYRAMAALWDLARRTRRWRSRGGVIKYASLEEKNRAQTMADRERCES
jgi:hypothetical protein